MNAAIPEGFGVQDSGSRGLAQGVPSLRADPCAQRPAFTLVELLVVITIIGILAALGSVAAFKALETAKSARIVAEMQNLDAALKAYKEKYGDYPPSYMKLKSDATNTQTLLKRHLAKAFPRCDPTTEMNAIKDSSGNVLDLTPDEALVFWLTGISKDPARPLSAPTTDRQSFFDFDKLRVAAINAPSTNPVGGWVYNSSATPPLSYSPQNYHPINLTQPYVYFEASEYLLHCIDSTVISNSGCFPYLLETWDVNGNGKLDAGTTGPPSQDVQADSSNNWSPSSFQAVCANPKSFQIVSAGLDNSFGSTSPLQKTSAKYNGNSTTVYYKSYPGGLGYDTGGADDDNLTNFAPGKLGDQKP